MTLLSSCANFESVAEATPERLGRKEKRARTHKRFVEGALALLSEGGPAALTVSQLAKRVGVHHSLFYNHFRDIDGCLAESATHVISALHPVDRELRRHMLRRAITDRTALTEYFEAALARWLEHRQVVELLLAHRLEHSKMGEALREALSQMREEMAAELWDLAGQMGVPERDRELTSTLSDLHLTHFLWGLEAVIDGRESQNAHLASVLAEMFAATNSTLFKRMTFPTHDEAVRRTFSAEQQRALDELTYQYRRLLAGPNGYRALLDVYGDGDLEQTVHALLGSVCQFYLPCAAKAEGVVAHCIEYNGRQVTRCLVINERTATLSKVDDCDPARVTVRYSLETFAQVTAGLRHFDECFRKGDLQIDGDIFFGAEVPEWFYVPKLTTASTPPTD